MNQIQKDTKEFMVAAGQPFATSPFIPSVEDRRLHAKLIHEETMETIYAMGFDLVWSVDKSNPEGAGHYEFLERAEGPDIVETYDGLADSSYVIHGAANAWGLDLQAGHDEAHRSNMSKFIDGYRRDDGKWIKGPSYSPADFKYLISHQLVRGPAQVDLTIN